MTQERALKGVLVVVGLLFLATVYPLAQSVWQSKEAETMPMMLSLYVTLGIFLLLAARSPLAHGSLIGFTAWSSFAHAAVMTAQAVRDVAERTHLLIGSAVFVVIGVTLIALARPKRSGGTA